ncbi:hypothetical protein GCM10023238_39520 [Streptomyces heliomycini]
MDGRGDLDRVDPPWLGVEQDADQGRRVPGQSQRAGEVVAPAGRDEAEGRAGSAEGAVDTARDAVPADGEDDPPPPSGLAGQFPRVGQAAAVLGPQVGALLAQAPGQGEQGRRCGGRARGGLTTAVNCRIGIAFRGGPARRGYERSGSRVSRRAAGRRG